MWWVLISNDILGDLRSFDYLMLQFLSSRNSLYKIWKIVGWGWPKGFRNEGEYRHLHPLPMLVMSIRNETLSNWLERGQVSKEIDASWWVISKILSIKSWEKNSGSQTESREQKSFQCPLVTSNFGNHWLFGDNQRNELFDLGCSLLFFADHWYSRIVYTNHTGQKHKSTIHRCLAKFLQSFRKVCAVKPKPRWTYFKLKILHPVCIPVILGVSLSWCHGCTA